MGHCGESLINVTKLHVLVLSSRLFAPDELSGREKETRVGNVTLPSCNSYEPFARGGGGDGNFARLPITW